MRRCTRASGRYISKTRMYEVSVCTSWARQEALIGTISQYHTQFSELGSEILTRDFKQAEQDIQNRMQKRIEKMSYYGRPKFLLKFEAGKSTSIFFVFCISLLLFFSA